MNAQSSGEQLPQVQGEDNYRIASSAEFSIGSSASSSSFAPGPGSLAARFLRWVGNAGLDAIQELVIRRRLAAIKQIVRNQPDTLTTPGSSRKVHQADRIYDDLQELCRGEYTLGVQRRAARLILEIACISARTSQSVAVWPPLGQDLWNRWNALLRSSNSSFTDRLWVQADDDLIETTDFGLSSMDTIATVHTGGIQSTVTSSSSTGSWTSVRLAGQRTVAHMEARAKLFSIQRTVRKRPYVFTSAQEPHRTQEVDAIFGDLAHLTRPHHSLSTRRKAARLVLEIVVMISGTREIFPSEMALEGNGVTILSSPPWRVLVTRDDVESFLKKGTTLEDESSYF